MIRFKNAAMLLFTVSQALAHQDALAGDRKAYELKDGSVVVGEVIDEGESGYLVRTPAGETVRVEYSNVERVTVLGAAPGDPAPSASSEGFPSDDALVLERGFQFPRGATIVVLPFKDNDSSDPRDSEDTGRAAQQAFLHAFEELTDLPITEVVGDAAAAAVGLTRSQAVEAAASAGVDYAVYGSCVQFYRVAPMTFRADEAGVTVEVVAADGTVVYRETMQKNAAANTQEPEDVLARIAKKIVKQVAP